MIKPAVIRWYLYALYLRIRRVLDRRYRPRALDAARANPPHTLFASYEDLAADLPQAARLRNHEFKVYSQNGEDGLIAYLFSQIGVTNRRFVEFGVGDGRECNSANLAIHFGWSGVMLEARPSDVRKAARYYGRCRNADGNPTVTVSQCRVTVDNIDRAISGAGVTGEIDLLSIDIDGNDYWIWQAIEVVRPRVVIIEYNASFGQRPITIPYDPGFGRFRKHRSGWYHGASLAALAKLGQRKGYDLVGTDHFGVNAFFIRQDVPKGDLDVVAPDDAYRPQRKRLMVATVEEQFAAIAHLPLVDV